MRNKLVSYLVTFRSMPFMLKWITVFSLAGVFFLLIPCFPNGDFSINGRSVTYREFWLSGAGPIILIAGILLLTAGVCFLEYKSIGRWLFLTALAVLFFPIIVASLESILSGVGVIAISAWYLFLKTTVKLYFNKGKLADQ